MLELALPPLAAPHVLAALAAVSGHPDEPRVAPLLAFVADELGTHTRASDASPAALAAVVPTGDVRIAVVQRLVLAAMLVPPLDAARLDRLEAYAEALGRTSEPALADLRKALAGHHRRLTASLMRRFPPMTRVRAYWRTATFGQR